VTRNSFCLLTLSRAAEIFGTIKQLNEEHMRARARIHTRTRLEQLVTRARARARACVRTMLHHDSCTFDGSWLVKGSAGSVPEPFAKNVSDVFLILIIDCCVSNSL